MPTESRTHVAQALHGVFGQGSRVPDSWDDKLSSEDAMFAKALLGRCLRRWGRLQAFIRPRLADPDRGLPLGSQVCLAIGLAQLAWLPGVSDHAAVNEAVDLTADRTLGFPPHKGLVNALLRSASKDRDRLRADLDALPAALDRSPFVDRVLQGALTPRGEEAHLEDLWARIQEPPRPAFRVVKSGPLPEGLEADADLPGCFQLAPGASFPRPWLADGAGMVQDRSSQALMNLQWDAPVHRIADLCAAPGGKTTALALRWPQAGLWAVEQHPRRARRLEENLRLRGVSAQIAVEDAVSWLGSATQPFDVILLDAPCSGSGTLCKHPELAWLGDGLDMAHLVSQQRALLQSALSKLSPGGLLVYSVCSWLPEEGLDHRNRILSEDTAFRPVPAWSDRFQAPHAGEGTFLPPPLAWDGEGFQAFALTRE